MSHFSTVIYRDLFRGLTGSHSSIRGCVAFIVKGCRTHTRVIAFLRPDPHYRRKCLCVSSQLTAPFPGEREKKSVGEDRHACAALASPHQAMVREVPARRGGRHDQRCRQRLCRLPRHRRPCARRRLRRHRRERGLLRGHGGHRVASPGFRRPDGQAGPRPAHHEGPVGRVRAGGGDRLAVCTSGGHVRGAARHRRDHQRFTAWKDHGRCRVLRRRDREFRDPPGSRSGRAQAGRCGGTGCEGYERRTACNRRFWRWTSTWWPRLTAA
jgi:hypothetical protein